MSLQLNVSETVVTEVRTAGPAFVVVEVRERTCSTRFVPGVGFVLKQPFLCEPDKALTC